MACGGGAAVQHGKRKHRGPVAVTHSDCQQLQQRADAGCWLLASGVVVGGCGGWRLAGFLFLGKREASRAHARGFRFRRINAF
jgi:hypothetical protein